MAKQRRQPDVDSKEESSGDDYVPTDVEEEEVSDDNGQQGAWSDNSESKPLLYTVKNKRSFQPFLGYLSCFCSYVSIIAHIHCIIIHSLKYTFQTSSSMVPRLFYVYNIS